jgi:hypothetical protein
MISSIAGIGAVLMLGLFFTGCASWQPAWDQKDRAVSATDVSGLLHEAERLSRTADDKASLLAANTVYEAILMLDPFHYQALVALGNQYILFGAAYCDSRSEKIRFYRQAMRMSEGAMYTNPDFRQRVDRGQTPWEACDVLTPHEIDAMFYWVTAVLYYFKEGMTLPEKIVNVDWVQWAGVFLNRIEEIDANWGGGGVQFSQALYYGILPASLGGDEEKCQAYLARSIRVGPEWLLNRWGRAKFFYVRDKNRAGFIEDLTWVVEQDIQSAGGVYPWKVYIQRDAALLLKDVDRYF